ncbi:hypothetical protein V2J09_003894 [Rumex salicifolius]
MSAENDAQVGEVIVFRSSAKWRAYFESSKTSNKLIVIDFTAEWCGPCKLMEPTLDELAAKYSDVDFVSIDVDELLDVTRKFEIHAMPTFLFVKNGEEIDQVVGVKREELHNKVDQHRRLAIDANIMVTN